MNFSEAQSFLTKQQEWIQVIFSIFWLKMDHLKQPPIETWTIMSWACLLRCCGRCRLAHSLTIKYLLAASCVFTDGSNYPKHQLNLAVLNQLLVSSVGSKHLESIKHCNKLNLGQTYWPMTIQIYCCRRAKRGDNSILWGKSPPLPLFHYIPGSKK